MQARRIVGRRMVGRRIVKKIETSRDWDCTTVYYYDGQKLIETHNGSEQVISEHLWGLQYIDELVQIAVNDDPADAGEDDCESVYYACHNANFNVLGVVDDSGDLVERYEYTPYGERVVFVSSGSNDADTSAPTLESARVVTAGSVTQPYGLCEVGHQGLIHDKETTLVYNRARMHHPRLGRFVQRDPLGYVDGMGLYAYVDSSPLKRMDPSGTDLYESHPYLFTDLTRPDRDRSKPWLDPSLGQYDRRPDDQEELSSRGLMRVFLNDRGTDSIIVPIQDFNTWKNMGFAHGAAEEQLTEAGMHSFAGRADVTKPIKDATHTVAGTIKEMRRKWADLTEAEKCMMCTRPVYFANARSWDLRDFGKNAFGGNKPNQLAFWSVGGKNYRGYEINYLVWGVYNRLCDEGSMWSWIEAYRIKDFKRLGKALIYAHKASLMHLPSKGTIGWYDAGYDLWREGDPAPESDWSDYKRPILKFEDDFFHGYVGTPFYQLEF